MAAAEYFQVPPRPQPSQQPSNLAPPTGPQRASSHPNVNFHTPQYAPQLPHQSTTSFPSGAPPPYASQVEEHKPSVHFAPTPSPLQHGRHSFSHPRPPPNQSWAPPVVPQPQQSYSSSPNFRPQAQPYPQQQLQGYPQPQPPPYHPQQRPTRPYHQANNFSTASLSTSGYSSEPEPHRRHRHRHRRDHSPRRDHESHHRRVSDAGTRSRSAHADGLLGAAGGGLIGDLIFPGLGTVGGAVAGWLGGKDYGEKRKHREVKRERAQIEWEDRYAHDGRRRSNDRAYEKDHYDRDDYERRRSHDRERKRDYSR